ncbi:MAG TPA: hypothetical protein PLZ57_10930 [Pseudobdellovibrionaceae bacterium]|nr:hypothetical protein [Pseudobdellovibrionaceae bacterium]
MKAKDRQARQERRGEAGFNRHHEARWGSRWLSLREALRQPARKVAYELSRALATRERVYHLDAGSLFPPLALQISVGEEVLDLCAAPGGKSLVMWAAGASRLIANEVSDPRRARLKATLHDFLTDEQMLEVKVTGFDAQKWGLHEANVYDAVLADVPCSGERHLLQDADELQSWSPQRSSQLAIRQYAILASALTAAKPGGRIAYSTCSISEDENDAVMAKLAKRRGAEFERMDLPQELLARANDLRVELEPTTWGYWILPDRSENAGPIYFSLVRKSHAVSM